MIARVARIYPAHIFSIVLLVAAFWPYSISLFSEPYLGGSLINIFLLQSWSPNDFYSLNAPSWSISVEFALYAMFPALLSFLKKNGIIRALMLQILAVIALVFIDLFIYMQPPASTWIGYINPIINIPTFALGIASGLACLKVGLYNVKSNKKHMIALLSLIIALYISSIIMGGQNTPLAIYIHVSACAPIFAILFYYISTVDGLMVWALSRKVIVYLGEISFSLYLVHQIVFRWMVDNRELFSMPIFGQWIFAVFLSIFISIIMHHLIERPGRLVVMSVGKRIVGGVFSSRMLSR